MQLEQVVLPIRHIKKTQLPSLCFFFQRTIIVEAPKDRDAIAEYKVCVGKPGNLIESIKLRSYVFPTIHPLEYSRTDGFTLSWTAHKTGPVLSAVNISQFTDPHLVMKSTIGCLI